MTSHFRLFLRQLPTGFALSAAVASVMLSADLAGVWQLATSSEHGLVGLAALVAFNGLLFTLVLFAIGMVLRGMERRPATGRRHLPARAAIPIYAPRDEHTTNYRR